jgi:hypothetical protein
MFIAVIIIIHFLLFIDIIAVFSFFPTKKKGFFPHQEEKQRSMITMIKKSAQFNGAQHHKSELKILNSANKHNNRQQWHGGSGS